MACQDCVGLERKYHEALQDVLGAKRERNDVMDKLLAAKEETNKYLAKAEKYLVEADKQLDKVIDLEAKLALKELSPWKAIALTEAGLAVAGLIAWLLSRWF